MKKYNKNELDCWRWKGAGGRGRGRVQGFENGMCAALNSWEINITGYVPNKHMKYCINAHNFGECTQKKKKIPQFVPFPFRFKTAQVVSVLLFNVIRCVLAEIPPMPYVYFANILSMYIFFFSVQYIKAQSSPQCSIVSLPLHNKYYR